MQLSEQQFDKLVEMIEAKIEARFVKNSAGPHVRGLREVAEHRETVAKLVLVDGMVFD